MNLRSLQENVTEATQALDNVAEFIEDKTGNSSVFSTVRPINYGDILNNLDFSGGNPTFAQVTVYKTQNKAPAKPVGGEIDLVLGTLKAPEGWEFKPSSTKDVWASTSLWYGGVIQNDGWSTPFVLTGKDGVVGEKGEQGEAGVSYRTVNVYTTTDSIEDVPGQPQGGFWNIKTNEISLPVAVKTYWYLNADDEPQSKKYKWVSTVTFGPTGDPMGEWSIPIRITGEDGKDGADGRVIEFIYRQVPNYEKYTELRYFLNVKENKLPSVNESDYIPVVNDDLGINTVWTDRPIGVSTDMQIEVVCSRIRKNVESSWEDWSECAIWSKWGEDGMDGDGVEYIYLVTPSEINGIPTTSNYVKDMLVPNYSLEGKYQNDEFCFNDEWGFEGYDWTDEPRDVGPGEPMEWVMIRKQKDGIWQPFSDPALWATYSENGVSYITSFVFTRATVSDNIPQPVGGDYTNPHPTKDGSADGERDTRWSDSVPSEGTLPVWMSTRTFCSKSQFSDDDWSEPKMLADSTNFQVEYSADPNVTGDKITKFTGDEISWRAAQPFIWGDDSEITDPIWMITATCHGGVWSDWTLSKIKGEKGDKGDAGTSVSIQHKVKTLAELKAEWNDYVNGLPFFTNSAGLVGGEGVYVEEEGLLYVYSGGYYPGENTNFDLYWTSIHVKGEPGDSAYLYIRFTDGTDSSATLYENTPKKYIGVKYSTEKITDPAILNAYDTYMWSPWRGEDGWGQEQIFLATTDEFNPEIKHLPLPSSNEQVVDFLPTHNYGAKAYPSDKWSDSPVSVSKEYPYCWVVTRKSQGGVFGEWKGIDGVAALYSRYSYDGVNSVYVDLSNDLAIIPMQDGKIDPDFKDTVSTTVRVHVGDESIPETDFIVTCSGDYVVINGDEVTLKLSSLNDTVKQIPLTVTLKDSSYKTVVNWNILQTDAAYEIELGQHIIKRYVTGDKVGQLETTDIHVDVWKWSDAKWIASNIPVFAKVTYLTGDPEILSTEDGTIETSKNLHTIIHLGNRTNVTGIRVYIVQADDYGKYYSNYIPISFEDVTVVADGVDGVDGPGFEYIFCVTAPDVTADMLYGLLQAYSNSNDYQNDDWTPPTGSDWTDEPIDVSESTPLEWVSTRRKINGTWEPFTMPKIWAKYASDATSYKTVYVFTRSNTKLSSNQYPKGGQYPECVPTNNNIWKTVISDGIGDVWMSYKMFDSENKTTDDWSIPVKLSDTKDFSIIYGTEYADMKNMPEKPFNSSANQHGWYDEPVDGIEFHYMATSTYSNGEWSEWIVSKIKGEPGTPGERGQDGKSVTIKGRFVNEDALRTAWNTWLTKPSESGFSGGGDLDIGDGYLVDETGDLWVFNGGEDTFNLAWTNVGRIQGAPGQSMYLYIGYRNSLTDTSVKTNAGAVGKYIGIKVSNVEISSEDLKKPETYDSWTKWQGDDGWGWEQVFVASQLMVAPQIQKEDVNLSEADLLTKYPAFSDTPLSIDGVNNLYVWYFFRKTNEAWKGAITDNAGNVYGALYDRYAKDGTPGKGVKSIVKDFASNNSSTEHPTSGWGPIENVNVEDEYIWCREYTIFTDDSQSDYIYYITSVKGAVGATGTGKEAPMIYPAGVWNATTLYESTDTKCPYVYYVGTGESKEGAGYYVLKTQSKSRNQVPNGTDSANPWEQMESFTSVYSDIGVFNQALVGQWVFHGDYMFSQKGVDKSGNEVDYSDFEKPYESIINGDFVPNTCFNALTGEVQLNKLSLKATTSSGQTTSTEMSLAEVVEDIVGQKVVKTNIGDVITIEEDFLNKKFIPASKVNDLIDISNRLIHKVDKILIEIDTSTPEIGGGDNSGDVDDNLDKIYFGEGAAIVANLRSTTSANQYIVSPIQTFGMIDPDVVLGRENECYPSLSKFNATIDCFVDTAVGSNVSYPINIGGNDDDVLLNPITGIEIPIEDADGNKPTIGWLKDQIKQIRKFEKWVEQIEEVVIGKRTSQITGGISYLKDVYKDASTEIEGGAITTGVVLGGTIAVKGDAGQGDRIVAGLHNGSDELLGSQGSGLMLFTGAEGIETVTEEIEGVETKISTSVNNASVEFYKDGRVKIGDDDNGVQVHANGTVEFGSSVKVRKVETKSNASDRIEIQDNHLYCINNSGDKNLIISSDALDTELIDAILAKDSQGAESRDYLNNITLTGGTYDNYTYSNTTEWFNSLKVKEIGYCFKNATVSVRVYAKACTQSVAHYNSAISSNMVPAADWNIDGNVNVYLYKKQSDGTWAQVQKKSNTASHYWGQTLRSNWTNAADLYTTSGINRTEFFKICNNNLSFSITEPGEYGIKMSFNAYALQFNKSIGSMLGGCDVTLSNNNAPSTYTEIGKDGIVVYDGINVLKLDSTGVEMKAKTGVGSNSFYGIKVTSEGMYISNGGTEWLGWFPSGYATSTASWE